MFSTADSSDMYDDMCTSNFLLSLVLYPFTAPLHIHHHTLCTTFDLISCLTAVYPAHWSIIAFLLPLVGSWKGGGSVKQPDIISNLADIYFALQEANAPFIKPQIRTQISWLLCVV